MPKGRLLDPARKQRVALKKSRVQERRSSDEFGTRLTPASGSRAVKGDSVSREWMVENKRTDASQYVLKKSELRKARLQATLSGRRMVFQVDIGGERGDRYVVLSLDDALELGVLK